MSSIVRSPALPRPGSPSAGAFASAFLDRLCQELEVGDRDSVEVWADGAAERDEAVEHARIVVIGCAVIAAAYVADCGNSDEVISYLAIRSGELEKRFRVDRAQRAARPADSAKLVNRDDVVASLGMGPDDQTFAALAGTLHDVGKIATPSAILLKPGPLEALEWEAMREHSAIGAKMLERIPSLRDLAPVVRAHHERIDGRGYPDALCGDGIPFVSRIVSVADSFHAMISKRPYREALTVPYALDELRAGVGTQWDRVIVDTMLEIVQPRGVARPLRAVRGAAG